MDNATRQFIIRTIKKLSQEARQAVVAIRSDLQKQSEAITKSAEAAEQNRRIPQEVIANVDFSQGIETRKSKSDAGTDDKHQRRTLFVAWLTLIAIVSYAVLVYFQWQEMIASTDAAQQAIQESRRNRRQNEIEFRATIEQFHLDQRAWIAVEDAFVISVNDRENHVRLILKNFGKTPARHVRYAQHFRVGTMSGSRVDGLSRSIIERGPFHSIGPLAPSQEPSVDLIDDDAAKGTPSVFPMVQAGTAHLSVLGVFEYEDVFGKTHRTWYCVFLPDIRTKHMGLCENPQNQEIE